MGKIAPVSAKYIVHATIDIEGVVERPDVIGAVFGQTEGLLGADLELRELQRSGRIGRIEVKSDIKGGKTHGEIIIPSSLDKAETAIIGAAMETIQRIGPCNSVVKVGKIEDVRISKRGFIIDRAKDLLKNLTSEVLPDSQEITEEVAKSVRMMEIVEYGKDKLPAGPSVEESDEIILVEGRADVLNLLKHGIKNIVGMHGTKIPESVVELSKRKTITLFVDGDRGGDIILKGLNEIAEIDFFCKAPDGKEVEELTKKELHKALRGKITIEQAKMEMQNGNGKSISKPVSSTPSKPFVRNSKPAFNKTPQRQPFVKKQYLNASQKEKIKGMVENVIGTRGAFILDGSLSVLGKVPVTELDKTLKAMNNVFALVIDGEVSREVLISAERSSVKHIVMTSDARVNSAKINVVSSKNI